MQFDRSAEALHHQSKLNIGFFRRLFFRRLKTGALRYFIYENHSRQNRRVYS
jgi:hypothetical protein